MANDTTKTFDGKIFRCYLMAGKKSQAQKRAKGLRVKGYKARVIKGKSRWGAHYSVYARY